MIANTKPKKRPKQDLDEWPGSLWTQFALDRLRRDREGKS